MTPAVRNLRLGLGVALAVASLDQATKAWMLALIFNPPRVIEVTPFFNLAPAWNRGVSFGLLAHDSPWAPWLLSALATVIVVFLLRWLARAENLVIAVALGLVLGGAVGNAIDRLRFGAVVDFLDIHALGWHFWAFNLADAGITVGAVTLLLLSFLPERLSRVVDQPK
ncbi:MAG: signal peptidase II [Alphaproteobacteria bacterium]|nr:signal peptidase II [Alphaproteobacteria bacterium]